METEKTFRTKTGYCHILPDRIVLTRDGVIGNLAHVVSGNRIYRILIIYGFLACFLLYRMYNLYTKGHTILAIVFGLFAAFLVYGVFTSLNHSAAPIILRNKIKSTRFKKAIPGLTRSHFVIIFEDEHGKIKKRMILLPGSMTGGQTETENALKIMREENLLSA